MKMRTTQRSFSAWDNIRYILIMQWIHARKSVLTSVLLLLANISIAFMSVYMPKLVVQLALARVRLGQLIICIGGVGLGIALLNVGKQLLEILNNADLIHLKNEFMKQKTKGVLNTSYENLESEQYRNLMQRADEVLWSSGDGSVIEQMVKNLYGLLTSIVGYFLFGVALSSLNPFLLVWLTILPLLYYFALKKAQNYQFGCREVIGNLDRKLWYVSYSSGVFHNAKDIRMYGMLGWFTDLFSLLINDRAKLGRKVTRRNFGANIVEACTVLMRDGLAYLVLIHMTIQNKITIDEFVFYFGAIASFSVWVNRILNYFAQLNSNCLLLCDYRDFLAFSDDKRNGQHPTNDIPDNKGGYEIELVKVSYRYKGSEHDTLHEVSLKVSKGEKLAIVGLNGAGKTTLVKIICGLYTPTKGNVFLNHTEQSDILGDALFSLYSTVFQDTYLLPLTIAEIVSSSEPSVVDRGRVEYCLTLAGLDDLIHKLPGGMDARLNRQINDGAIDLSGGEKQKLLLARAIYKDAPILILDEPTAALDPIAEGNLYEQYHRLTQNRTSIYISHRLSSTRFCDRIIYIENGEIIEEGSHEALMNLNKKYAQLYRTQSQYYN